jgi:hypothetical protein
MQFGGWKPVDSSRRMDRTFCKSMRPSGFEPLASSSGGFPSGPTCTDIRGNARFFVLGAGPASPARGRCVTQSVTGDSLGATPLNPALVR